MELRLGHQRTCEAKDGHMWSKGAKGPNRGPKGGPLGWAWGLNSSERAKGRRIVGPRKPYVSENSSPQGANLWGP